MRDVPKPLCLFYIYSRLYASRSHERYYMPHRLLIFAVPPLLLLLSFHNPDDAPPTAIIIIRPWLSAPRPALR